MTKLLSISLLLATTISAFGQVAIGKTTTTNSTVSLEFGTGNRGIILPYVTSANAVENSGVVNGTFIFDANDKKVKLRANNAWKDLTIQNNGNVNTSIQDNKTEKAEAKALIGPNASSDTTPGILVLSATDKAMILPKVESPHLNISNPAAGMMVYDTKSRQLAVYNGTVWTFWRP